MAYIERGARGCYVCARTIDYVFDEARRREFAKRLDMMDTIINKTNLEANRLALRDTEVIVSTWGMESFNEAEIETYFPNLKLVLYAAGSVRHFAEPFLRRGVRVISAWGAMAVAVAEYTLSAILHANKGFYLSMARYRSEGFEAGKRIAQIVCPGTYSTTVGVLGAGMIGTNVIKLLKHHSVDIKVFDPFMPRERADELGVKLCGIEEVFETSQTITNHIANNPQTVGMLNYELFRRMGKSAAFINTGRGAQVVEADLARAMREAPDRCAVLDVTWPEVCPKEHPFWTLPNVFITPHIAGYAAREVFRLSDCMLEELDRCICGEANLYCVTPGMLRTMA